MRPHADRTLGTRTADHARNIKRLGRHDHRRTPGDPRTLQQISTLHRRGPIDGTASGSRHRRTPTRRTGVAARDSAADVPAALGVGRSTAPTTAQRLEAQQRIFARTFRRFEHQFAL